MRLMRLPVARFVACALTVVGLTALTGCDGNAGGTFPIHGKVVYADGSPVTGGTINFEPEGTEGEFASGIINSDGTYEIRTTDKLAGAKPGKYRVSITPPEVESEGENTKPPPPPIDRKFMIATTSGLTAEVKPGNNEFKFTVERPTNPKGKSR
jgi:hypothetical protein